MLPEEMNIDVNKTAFLVPSRKTGSLIKYNEQKLKNEIETQRKLHQEFKRKCKEIDKIMKRLKEENEYEKERDRLEEKEENPSVEEYNKSKEEEEQNKLGEKENKSEKEKQISSTKEN